MNTAPNANITSIMFDGADQSPFEFQVILEHKNPPAGLCVHVFAASVVKMRCSFDLEGYLHARKEKKQETRIIHRELLVITSTTQRHHTRDKSG